MIFTSINNDNKSFGYSNVLLKVIEFLKNEDFSKKEVGEYELEGRDIYYQVIETETEENEKRFAESHKKYLDIQYVVNGREKIGFTPLLDEYKIKEFIEERDLLFYEQVKNEGYIIATEGCISIFFPEDVHRPQIAIEEPERLKKVVVKVKKDII